MHEMSHSEEKKAIWTRNVIVRGIFVLFLVIAVFVVLLLLGIILLD